MNAEGNRKDGAGCLVILGLLGLLPVLFAVWIFGSETWREARSVLGAIRWSGVASIWKGLLELIRSGSRGDLSTRIPLFFAAGYITLLWQWVMLVWGKRTLISEHRLWALSSAYFAAIILSIGIVCHQAIEARRPYAEDSPGSNPWSWFVATVVLSTIPACFLSITVPLWVMTPRPASRREKAGD